MVINCVNSTICKYLSMLFLLLISRYLMVEKYHTLCGILITVICCKKICNGQGPQLSFLTFGIFFGEMPCANVLGKTCIRQMHRRFAYRWATGTILLLKTNGMFELVMQKEESTFALDRIGGFTLHIANNMHFMAPWWRNHHQQLLY